MKFVCFILILELFALRLNAQERNIAYYIDHAMLNSPLIKDYQNQLQINTIDSMRLRAGFGPQINMNSFNSYAPVFHGWGFDEAITNGANINAVLSASQDITAKKYRSSQYQEIQLKNISASNSRKISEQDLRKEVTEQYITTFGAWQQYNYSIEIINILRNEEAIFKRLTEQGIYKQTEYLAFRISLQQQEIQLLQDKIQYQNSFAALNYMCGIADTSVQPVYEPYLHIEIPPKYENSIFFQQFIIDSLKLATNDEQIEYSYKPKISIYGEAGYYSSLAFQPEKNFGTSVGLNITVPVYDGQQRKMQHDKISVEEQTRQNYNKFYTAQYEQQMMQLKQQLDWNRQVGEQADKQTVYAKSLMDLNHKLIESGDVHVADYILAITSYIAAKKTSVQYTVVKYRIINQINYWSREK